MVRNGEPGVPGSRGLWRAAPDLGVWVRENTRCSAVSSCPERLDEVEPARAVERAGARGCPEEPEDRAHVVARGVWRDAELERDLLRQQALVEEAQHLELARRQLGGRLLLVRLHHGAAVHGLGDALGEGADGVLDLIRA